MNVDIVPVKRKKTVEQPKDLYEALDILINQLQPFELEHLKTVPEDYATGLHHHLGRYLRNDWHLWEDNDLTSWFGTELGVYHADDLSGLILTSLWKKVNNVDLDLQKEAQYYKDFWASQGTTGKEASGR